ncbi:unnamed protein product [Hymenolepis diminuta]|uniref:Uncharacterized protein n=1 Tax=Hymenolepis diminuta TaxID=6216 RepID=A0A564YRQ0_HYMDI|nr:unnamed protein product [Hymenolepis diminuta]
MEDARQQDLLDRLQRTDRERQVQESVENPIMSKKTLDRVCVGLMAEDICLKLESELKSKRNVVLTYVQSERLRNVIREEIRKRSDKVLHRKQ